jgi:hypothetical protein
MFLAATHPSPAPTSPPTPSTEDDEDSVGRAVVLGRLYRVMRVNLGLIGVAWFAPLAIRTANWEDVLLELECQSDASARDPAPR